MKRSNGLRLIQGIVLTATGLMSAGHVLAAPAHQLRHGTHTYHDYGYKNGTYYYHRHYNEHHPGQRRQCWYDDYGVRHCQLNQSWDHDHQHMHQGHAW